MPQLHPVPEANGKYTLPHGVLQPNTRREESYMHFPEGIKVPTGFSANVKKLVSMKDLSIIHCKAHDCHVMLTVFLPIAIKAIKPEFLKMVITRMCYFFLKIS